MLGEFRLLRRIGGGGMAEVWLAEQTSLKRQVAVKVMKPATQADETCRRRFEQEAFATAGLNHPSIAQVYAIGEAEGVNYIAQEYVAGMNMRDYILKKGPPPVHIAVHLMKQVAAALQAAAERGIVHRDIKPENILLTRKGVAKVVDFGLAQLTQGGDVRLTQAGMTMGTPLYMSPEQVQGLKVDQRSDLYSLGATFFHLLAGRPPFHGETALAVAYHQVHTPPPAVTELRPDVSPALSRLIQRLLAKHPDDRFPSAQALLQELRQLDNKGDHEGDFAMPVGVTAENISQPSPSPLVAWRDWLSPTRHPGVAFVIWGVLFASVFAAIGHRTKRPSSTIANLPKAKLARVERQPTIARQLELAQKVGTEDAWWAVLRYFEGNAPENHFARQELIPRMFQQQRLAEAERLCDEVLAAGNAPESAIITAWAGRAFGLTLQGRMADAERIEQQHLRAGEDQIQRPLGAWLDESLQRRRGPPAPSKGSDATDRSRRRL
jgi:serine/threonine-protein kinase